MSNQHDWPEGEKPQPRPAEAPAGRIRRILRAIGDMSLTAGMAKGFQGDNSAGGSSRAASNAILFGEAAEKGREASAGASTERPNRD